MAFLWKASFFVVILVLSVSTSNLAFAQSYDNSSNSTNFSSVVCGYDLWGNLYLSEHGNPNSCQSGIPTIPSKVKGMLSPENIQNLVNRDRQLYMFMWLHPATVNYSAVDIPENCQYDTKGNFVAHLSDIQKEVLSDLKNNFGMFVCPLTGSPTPPLPTPQTPPEPVKLLGVTPAVPKCQAGQAPRANVCLSTQATCPSGFGLNSNICVFLEPTCPSGSISGKGICTLTTTKCYAEFCEYAVPPLSCPKGTYLDHWCVLTTEIQPTPPLTCPDGYGFQGNFCVVSSTLPRQTCPFGTVLQDNVCVANTKPYVPTSENSTVRQNLTHSLTVQEQLKLADTRNLPRSTLPPLKQLVGGISPQIITCNHGFVLLQSNNDHFSVCVKQQTAKKLIERGWGHYSR